MQKLLSILLLGLIFLDCSNTPSIESLQKFSATETYPEDIFLDTVKHKKALIIVAHDDDDCGMSGTIAKLTASGWTVKQLSLVSHLGTPPKQHAAHIICAGNELILADGIYRKGLDTIKHPYLPIPRKEMEQQFLKEKVAKALVSKIQENNPSVIFTLDNIKGGYGHPEHIFISQLVLDLFHRGDIAAQKIYQSVYTDHMEKEIVDTWLKAKMEKWNYPHASTIANELYGIDGMPEPHVQVSIRRYGEAKMAYLKAYPEIVRKNLRKFIPYHEQFEGHTYFSIFDREFFRVIEKKTHEG
ncbi:MAG: PIG-L family deacetylase [Bacteroidota bacterium]